MLSTGAQKDTQRVEKHEAFVLVQWFGQAEINRGETTRTPLHSLCSLCRGSSSRDLQRKSQMPIPLFTLRTAEPVKDCELLSSMDFSAE